MWNEPYNYQEEHVATIEGQRVINLGRKYQPGGGVLLVFINGMLARKGIDYEETNAYTITFLDDLRPGDVVLCQYQRLW
jgi:hypothetical protein